MLSGAQLGDHLSNISTGAGAFAQQGQKKNRNQNQNQPGSSVRKPQGSPRNQPFDSGIADAAPEAGAAAGAGEAAEMLPLLALA